MKLSDIRGEKALDIMADAMELADAMADDGRVKALMDDLVAAKGEDGKVRDGWRIFCKHFPAIFRDPEYKDRIMSIMAAASGVTVEEYAAEGPLLQDLFELLTSDAESLGFLLGQAAPKE